MTESKVLAREGSVKVSHVALPVLLVPRQVPRLLVLRWERVLGPSAVESVPLCAMMQWTLPR